MQVTMAEAVKTDARKALEAVEVKGAFAARLKEKMGLGKDVEGEAKKDRREAVGDSDVPAVPNVPVMKAEVAPVAVAMPVSDMPVAGGEKTAAVEDKGAIKGKVAVKKDGPMEAKPVAMKDDSSGLVSAPVAVVAKQSEGVAVQGVTAVAVDGVVARFSTKSAHAEVGSAVANGQAGGLHEETRVLVAQGNVLEVGLAAGVHGWLRVRAELGTGGEVSAQMIAGSVAGAESLHKEAPAITAYLEAEQVGLSSLVVQAPAASAGAQDATMSFGGQAGARQDGSAGKAGTLEGEPVVEHYEDFSFGIPLGALFQAQAGSGGWLSVRV